MAVEFKMPQLGESVVEGTIGRWLKEEGDRVEEYEPLLEVATDKVDTEVPSPVAGVLLEIRAREGETVRVGEVIAVLGEAGEVAPAGEGPEPEAEERTAPEQKGAAEAARVGGGERPGGPGYLTPVVARIAAEEGVDLSQVEGTGRHGRITKKDIQAYLARRQEAPAPAREDRAAVEREPRPAASQPALRVSATQTPVPAAVGKGDEEVCLSRMRQATARHMRRSKDTAAHVTTFFEVDLSRVVQHREANKEAFAAKGARLTYLPYFIEAMSVGIRAYPMLNAVFEDDKMIYRQAVNVGMAVDLGEEGLIVPVIMNADEKNLLGLAREVEDLAYRARTSSLTPDDVRGGTISITNHGVMGSLAGTPIIPLPQVAIMGVGAIQKRVVVVEDELGESMAIRPMVYLSLSFDHRAIDGATADRFMTVVKEYLEGYGE
jgi:pyruvate/2-oxoglutarate dehydrogenase complex dihydrolipoamide acyltransferase (E2) component